jgi:hypothetical protein
MLKSFLFPRLFTHPGRTLVLTASLGLFFLSCSRPEPLRIGTTEIPFQLVDDAYQSMTHSFLVEGHDTICRSLLMNGLAVGAILHQRLPQESAAARALAQEIAERLQAGSRFADELLRWTEEQSLSVQVLLPKQPSPSALGAAISAAVASLVPGEWAGPVQTSYGWELVFLAERQAGPRNRAQVSLYVIQFPVGSSGARRQAEADWSTLPLSGNQELMDCLSLEFRRNRIVSQDQK